MCDMDYDHTDIHIKYMAHVMPNLQWVSGSGSLYYCKYIDIPLTIIDKRINIFVKILRKVTGVIASNSRRLELLHKYPDHINEDDKVHLDQKK